MINQKEFKKLPGYGMKPYGPERERQRKKGRNYDDQKIYIKYMIQP